jgi:hypothetical protein
MNRVIAFIKEKKNVKNVFLFRLDLLVAKNDVDDRINSVGEIAALVDDPSGFTRGHNFPALLG